MRSSFFNSSWVRVVFSNVAVAGIMATVASQARAERIYGVTGSSATATVNSLVFFDSASVTSLTTVGTMSGILTGHTLRGIDFRPSNGLLYALSTSRTTLATAQLYTVNLNTGALTTVGSTFTLTGNTSGRVSIDFNPVVDVLRVITGTGQNFRVNATAGSLIAQDTTLNTTDIISDIAYSNNVFGATQTTLYAYNYSLDTFGTIGSVNGTPNSPNTGIYTTIGGSTVVAEIAATGLDTSALTGVTYAMLDETTTPTTASELYTVNVATGVHTLLGTTPADLLDISVFLNGPVAAPEPGSLALVTVAGLGMVGRVIRRKK